MSTLMLETEHLKFMEQLHMSWGILGSNTFNESKHPLDGWGFTTYVSDLAENEFATKKVLKTPSKL
jgi:hypothetical protein